MLAKEQNAILLAKLNYNQLLHLCTLEEQLHTTVQERDRIAQLNATKEIQKEISKLHDSVQMLQNNLARQGENVSQLLSPIKTTAIVQAVTKMKAALIDASTQNAVLIKENQDLRLTLSFFPYEYRKMIFFLKEENKDLYAEQQLEPMVIVPKPLQNDPQGSSTFEFEHADPRQPDFLFEKVATFYNADELIREVDESLDLKANSSHAQAAPMRQERNHSHQAMDTAPFAKGKRSGSVFTLQYQHAKRPRMESSTAEQPSPAPFFSKGKGKGGRNATLPPLRSTRINFYTLANFTDNTTCPYKEVRHILPAPLAQMDEPLHLLPNDAWMRERTHDTLTPELKAQFVAALDALRYAYQSTKTIAIQDISTNRYVNIIGQNLPSVAHQRTYNLIEERYSHLFGDYIRVLRVRPGSKPRSGPINFAVEYIPNALYSFKQVRNGRSMGRT